MTREELQKQLDNLDEGSLGKYSEGDWNKVFKGLSKNNFLKYNVEKCMDIAKPFTSTTQMLRYKGENQKDIRQVGHYINHKNIPHPKWFNKNIIWSDKLLLKEVKKYKTPNEWKNKHPSAYNAARRSKSREKIFSYLKREKSLPITKEDIIKRIKVYDTYKSFRLNDQPAYKKFKEYNLKKEDYFKI